MGCALWDYTVIAVIANSGCWILMLPDEETHGSDRYRTTLGGLDILTVKGPTNSGWSGYLDG